MGGNGNKYRVNKLKYLYSMRSTALYLKSTVLIIAIDLLPMECICIALFVKMAEWLWLFAYTLVTKALLLQFNISKIILSTICRMFKLLTLS